MRQSKLTGSPWRWFAAALITLIAIAQACGGSEAPADPSNPDPNRPSAMSATIDGSGWTASAVSVRRLGSGLLITGADGVRAISISFVPPTTGGPTSGPSTLIVGLVMFDAQSWQTNSSGGTVRLTTFTASRAVGTFSFTAVGGPGATPASRQVTNGQFDVPF